MSWSVVVKLAPRLPSLLNLSRSLTNPDARMVSHDAFAPVWRQQAGGGGMKMMLKFLTPRQETPPPPPPRGTITFDCISGLNCPAMGFCDRYCARQLCKGQTAGFNPR